MSFIGKTFYQRSKIDEIEARLSVINLDVQNNLTDYNQTVGDLQSLNSQINNNIEINVSQFSSLVDSLIQVDSVFISTFDSHVDVHDAQMLSLENVDSTFESRIDSHIRVYDAQVATLENIDSSLNSFIINHQDSEDNTFSQLLDENMIIDSSINSQIFRHNVEISKFDSADISIIERLDNMYSTVDSKLDSLFPIDSAFVSINNSFDSHIDSQISTFETQKSSLNLEDVSIISRIDSQTEAYVNQMNELDAMDSVINSSIDSHIVDFDNTVSVLSVEDSVIQFNINSQVLNQNEKFFLLSVIDSALKSSIEANQGTLTQDFMDLEAADSVNKDYFDSYEILNNQGIESLQNVDSVFNSSLESHIDVYDSKMSVLDGMDSQISSVLTSHISHYAAKVMELDSVHSSMDSTFDSNLVDYDSKMLALDTKDEQQDSRLTDLESRVDFIEDDISTRINSLIDERELITEASVLENMLINEDSVLRSNIELMVVTEVQQLIDSTQTSKIDARVEIVNYDLKNSALESLNLEWDKKLLAIEEFVRTTLASYKIFKPDGAEFSFTGKYQDVGLNPPDFTLLGKKPINETDWGLVVQFTEYGYNTLINEITIVLDDGTVAGTFTKADIDPATLQYTLVLPNSRDLSVDSQNFNVLYNNLDGTSYQEIEITPSVITSAPIYDPPILSYPSGTKTLIRGSLMTPIVITNEGGAVVLFTVSPVLPGGVSVGPTGTVSGTPTGIVPLATYTVSGTNAEGFSDTATLDIEVVDTIPDISYSSGSKTFIVGDNVSLAPSVVAGYIDSYSITGSLLEGLNFSTTTGVINGTLNASGSVSHVITATNTAGTDTFSLGLTSKNAPTFSYDNSTLTAGTAATITPTVSGIISSYALTIGVLPTGLTLDTSTGVISGTPSSVSSDSYTITGTAFSDAGNRTYTSSFTITVLGNPPDITYPYSSRVFVVGDNVSLTPTNIGGTATSWSISPALPTGVNLNTSTGVISGIPSAFSVSTNYIITATNASGNDTFVINMTFNALPTVDYGGSKSLTTGISTTITPTVTGSVLSYAVSNGTLPTGLSLNTSSGVISGTPTTGTASFNYIIIATIYSDAGNRTVSSTVNIGVTAASSGSGGDSGPSGTVVGGTRTITNEILTPEWGRWIVDSIAGDSAFSTYLDNLGSIYITGTSANIPQSSIITYFNEPKPNGTTSIGTFLFKYDSNGVPQWGRWIDAVGSEAINGITVDDLNNVYIVGNTFNPPQASIITYFDEPKPNATTAVSVFTIKYNSNGIPQWGRWINGGQGNGIVLDSNKNVYVTGQSTTVSMQVSLNTYFNQVKPEFTSTASFLFKYDSNGVPQWGRWLDGSGATDIGLGLCVDSLDNIYAVGQGGNVFQDYINTVFSETKPNAINAGAYIVKFNNNGVPQWGRWIDGTSTDIAYDVKADIYNNVYICGSTVDIQASIVTYFNEIRPGTNSAGFLFKYDSNGVPQWGRWLDGTGNEISYALGLGSNGDIYVVGSASNNLQSSLITYFNENKNNTSNAGFILKYNSLGVPIFGSWIDGVSSEIARDIYIDDMSNAYVLGQAQNVLQATLITYFNEPKPSGNNNGIYLIKYNNTPYIEYDKDIILRAGQNSEINPIKTLGAFNNITISPSLPSGLTLNSSTGVISGTPISGAAPQIYDVKIYYDNYFSTFRFDLVIEESNGYRAGPTAATDVTPSWARWIDGSSGDTGYDIVTDNNGNVYVFGSGGAVQSSIITFFIEAKPGTTTQGAFLFKYDRNGVPQWGRWIDGIYSDFGTDIFIDSNENIYVSGNTSDNLSGELRTVFKENKPGSTSQAGFIMKFNSSGTPQWGSWVDGAGVDGITDIIADNSGNVYISGYIGTTMTQSSIITYFNIAKPATDQAGFIMKLNPSGVPLWAYWLDGTSSIDAATALTSDQNGNVYVTGGCTNPLHVSILTYFDEVRPVGGSTTYIIKFNSSGVPQWGRWQDATTVNETSQSIGIDFYGNVYMCGRTSGTTIGTLGSLFNEEKPGSNSNGIFVVKYNTNGVAQWARWIDGTSDETLNNMYVEHSGNFYIAGNSRGDLQPSLITYFNGANNQTISNDSGFIMKFDSNGNAQWGKWIDGTGNDMAMGINMDKFGNLYVSGITSTALQSSLVTYFNEAKPGATTNGAFVIKYTRND